MTLSPFGVALALLVQTPPPVAAPTNTGAGGTPPGPVLTIEGAVALAEENAFNNRIAAANAERARQQYFLSETSLVPTVGASANVQRFGRQQFANLGGGSVPVSPLYGSTAGISLTLPLDLSGNLTRQIRAQRRNYAATREAERASRNTVRLTVRQAYFNALRSLALVGVSRQNVANAQAQLTQAEAQLAQLFIARIDVERLRSQLTQFQNELLVNENNYQLALQALNAALARPIETPTTLAEPADPPLTIGDTAAEADRLVTEAESRRPETLQIRQQIASLREVARSLEAGLNPSASLTISYQRNLNPVGFSAQRDTTSAGLLFNIPIFDAKATRYRVRAARQDVAVAEVNLEQARLQVSQDVRSALVTLRTARARLATAQAQVSYATEVERLARVRRDAGEATFLEVVDAQTQLALARNSVVTARYDAQTAFAQLQRAVGRDDVTTPLPDLDASERDATGPPPLPRTPGDPPKRASGAGTGSNEPSSPARGGSH